MKKKPSVQKIAIPILVIVALISLYIAYLNQGSNFWLTVSGGIATGTLVAVSQYFVSLAEYKEIDKAYKELHEKEKEILEFKKMGVKRILSSRDNPQTYGVIMSNIKRRLWIMGNTSSRLLDDFANDDDSSSDVWYRSELIKMLKNGVEVKIITAEKYYLLKDEKPKFDKAKSILEQLNSKYKNFNFVYFKHIPTHSIFVFDNQCLIGPIFDNLQSKATPALHMDTDSEYAQKYLQYFNHQWAEAVNKNDNKS